MKLHIRAPLDAVRNRVSSSGENSGMVHQLQAFGGKMEERMRRLVAGDGVGVSRFDVLGDGGVE